MRSVGSTTYPECRYIDVTSVFCISGVEIHFWQHFNVRLLRHSILRAKEWYFERRGFWEILGPISKAFLMGLEVLFFLRFLRLEVSKFLPMGLGVSDLSFYLSVWSSGVEFFRVHRYSLSN